MWRWVCGRDEVMSDNPEHDAFNQRGGNHRLPGSAIEACVVLPIPNDLDYFKAICEQRNSEIKRLKARLALYDKYLGDTMQKTENAELRAEIERLKGMGEQTAHD